VRFFFDEKNIKKFLSADFIFFFSITLAQRRNVGAFYLFFFFINNEERSKCDYIISTFASLSLYFLEKKEF
jgi:hypothetical protein